MGEVQTALDALDASAAVAEFGKLKTGGDLLPQTFQSMVDTGVASIVTLNQLDTAAIRGDIDKLTGGANIARDAAALMTSAWAQALRDSTADFQAIGRHIDEESRRLQSLPWTPPAISVPSIPSGTRSIPGMGVYGEGGIVPGPFGRPQWGLLHGGEEVIPAGRRGEATVNNYHAEFHISIAGSSEEALGKFEQVLNRSLRNAGYGGSQIAGGAFIPS